MVFHRDFRLEFNQAFIPLSTSPIGMARLLGVPDFQDAVHDFLTWSNCSISSY